VDGLKLQAQCKDFKCAKGATSCCCRQILYNQPDFVDVKSNLKIICEARGFQVIFLPILLNSAGVTPSGFIGTFQYLQRRLTLKGMFLRH